MLGSRVQGVGFTEKRSGPMSGSQKEGPFQGPFFVRVLPSFGVLKKGPEKRALPKYEGIQGLGFRDSIC